MYALEKERDRLDEKEQKEYLDAKNAEAREENSRKRHVKAHAAYRKEFVRIGGRPVFPLDLLDMISKSP